MGLENVKYDAFISYRHSDLDKATAMAIQKKLENFKLPKSVIGKTPSGKNKIERVFRDQDELPLASNLSDPIEDALANSDFLIVICTPRLPESRWCAKEIETFMALHGRERIFAVLAEGEPEESFPDILRFERRIIVEGDGTQHEVVKEFEPLAADVRGKSAKERKKLIDDAVLRLAAPIFGLNYDDLKQRHKEQRTKKIIATSASIAAVFFVFAMVCMFLAFQISAQKDTIEGQFTEIENKNKEIESQNKEITKQNVEITKQNEEISKKNEEITRQNSEILAKNDEITKKNLEISEQYRREQKKYSESMADASFTLALNGLRRDALYVVRNAMPDTKDSDEIPYSSAAEYALSSALGIYRRNQTYQAVNAFRVNNNIYAMQLSPELSYMVVVDSSDTVRIYDAMSAEEIDSFHFVAYNYSNDSIMFINDDVFIISDISSTYRYSISKKELTVISEDIPYSYAFAEASGKYVLYDDGLLNVYSAKDNSFIATFDIYQFIGSIQLPLHTISRSTVDPTGKILTLTFETMASYKYIVSVDLDALTLLVAVPVACDETNGFIVDNTLYTISYINSNFGETQTTNICAYDLTTGEVVLDKSIPNCRLDKFTYSKKEHVLLLHGAYHYCAINLKSKIKNLLVVELPSEMINYYYNNDGSVYFISNVGKLYIYSFAINSITEYTLTWFTSISNNYIDNAIFQPGNIYVAYSGEDYIAHYAYIENKNLEEFGQKQYYSNTNLNMNGTIQIDISHNKKGQTVHSLINTSTSEEICRAVSDYDEGYFFVDDGLEYWGTYLNDVHLYDMKGNLIRTITPSTGLYFSEISPNGKYAIYNGFDDDGNRSINFISIESGELITSISGDVLNQELLFADQEDCFIAIDYDNDLISLYRYDSTEPYAQKNLNTSSITNLRLSNDGRYLLALYSNYTLEVYSTKTMDLVSTIYSQINYINSVDYLETIDAYLVNCSSYSFLMSPDFEIMAQIYDCLGFDKATNQFIIFSNSKLYRCNYVPYDEMIKRTDNVLGDFKPIERILKKYHV